MSAIAAIVLADGQATPVNHTFSPVNIKGDVATFTDRSGGIAVGFPVLAQSVRGPVASAKSRNYRVTYRLAVPTLEVTSPATGTGIQPAPTKAYDCIAELHFIMPERSTLAERKNLKAYVKNLLAQQVVTDAVENLDNVY